MLARHHRTGHDLFFSGLGSQTLTLLSGRIPIYARVTSKIVGKRKEKAQMTIGCRGREAPKWHDSNCTFEGFDFCVWAYLQSSSPFLFPFYKKDATIHAATKVSRGLAYTSPMTRPTTCRVVGSALPDFAALNDCSVWGAWRLPTSLRVKNAWHIRPQVWKMGTQAPLESYVLYSYSCAYIFQR